MATTIAVQKETLDILKHARDEMKADSYDAVIRRMLLKEKQPKKSMLGSLRGIEEFKRDHRDRFD
jgi:hypothetical protein